MLIEAVKLATFIDDIGDAGVVLAAVDAIGICLCGKVDAVAVGKGAPAPLIINAISERRRGTNGRTGRRRVVQTTSNLPAFVKPRHAGFAALAADISQIGVG